MIVLPKNLKVESNMTQKLSYCYFLSVNQEKLLVLPEKLIKEFAFWKVQLSVKVTFYMNQMTPKYFSIETDTYYYFFYILGLCNATSLRHPWVAKKIHLEGCVLNK